MAAMVKFSHPPLMTLAVYGSQSPHVEQRHDIKPVPFGVIHAG